MVSKSKKSVPTFRQQALMISSCGELSTQAMEDVQSTRASEKQDLSGDIGSCTSASAIGGSSSSAGLLSSRSGSTAASCMQSNMAASNGETWSGASVEIVDFAAPVATTKKPRRK
jgi:hypothetical protein